MSTAITTTSVIKEQNSKTALLKQLKPLFEIQNDRISKIEYCMYGVNNHNWLNEKYMKNIPVYLLVRQGANKLTEIEKDLNEKFEGIQETANIAFSDTRGIDVTIEKKIEAELKKAKSSLNEDLVGVKAGFETRLSEDKKRLDLIEKALVQLEKTPVGNACMGTPVKNSRPVTPDKMGETVNRNIQKKMITDECNRILSEILPSYCKEKSVAERFLNHGKNHEKLVKRLDEAENKNLDLEIRLKTQENNVNAMKQLLKDSGDSKMVQTMLVRDTTEKILVEISSMSDAWFFKDRVTEELAPDYSKFVTSPICLMDMKTKNSEYAYTQLDWFVHDFRLMIKNAKDYNFPSDNAETTKPLILRVEKIFEQKLKDLPPNVWIKTVEKVHPKSSAENSTNNTFEMLPTPKLIAPPSTASSSAVITNILSNSNCTKIGPQVQISPEKVIHTDKTPSKRPLLNKDDLVSTFLSRFQIIRESISVLDRNQNKIFSLLGISKSEVCKAPPEKKSKLTAPNDRVSPPDILQSHLQPILGSLKSNSIPLEPKSVPLIKGFSRLKGVVENLQTTYKVFAEKTGKLEEDFSVLDKQQKSVSEKTEDLGKCFSSLDNQQKAVSDKMEENFNDLKVLIDKNKTDGNQVFAQKVKVAAGIAKLLKGINDINENVNSQTYKCNTLETTMDEANLPELRTDIKKLKVESLDAVTAYTEIVQKTGIIWTLPILQQHIHHASQPQQVQTVQNYNSQNQFNPNQPQYMQNQSHQPSHQQYTQNNIPTPNQFPRNTTGSPHFAAGSPQTNNSPKNTPQK